MAASIILPLLFPLGLPLVVSKQVKDFYESLENIPVEQWLRKWSGKRTFETIWLPLLRSKLGESYRETSAAFISHTGLRPSDATYVARFQRSLSPAES